MSAVAYILCERIGTKWVPVLRWDAPGDTCRAVAEDHMAQAKGQKRIMYFQKVQTVREWHAQKNYVKERESEAKEILGKSKIGLATYLGVCPSCLC